MARSDRTGDRKKRGQGFDKRIPELGYYIIVTDTEATERFFFEGLHDSLPEATKNKIVIKVYESRTQDLIQECLRLTAYDAQYRIPWIVFDRDQVKGFDRIVDEAEHAGIHVGWSNPCFEIWLYAYFGNMPNIHDSRSCCERFSCIFKKRTEHEYSKSDVHLYKYLMSSGDEGKALSIAHNKLTQCTRNGYKSPSEMCPCTTVHQLVSEIRSKVKG